MRISSSLFTLIGLAGLGLLTACDSDRVCREPGYTCEKECEEGDEDCTPLNYPFNKGKSDSSDGHVDDTHSGDGTHSE